MKNFLANFASYSLRTRFSYVDIAFAIILSKVLARFEFTWWAVPLIIVVGFLFGIASFVLETKFVKD